MEETSLLVVATQYMFWVGFVGMVAATLYCLVERNSLSPEYRSTATVAALVTFIAAIHYDFMKDSVGTLALITVADSLPMVTDGGYIFHRYIITPATAPIDEYRCTSGLI